MYFLVNGEEMKSCDSYTIKNHHVPSLVLMEHAAQAFVEELLVREKLETGHAAYNLTRVGIVCGSGNNGGDGLAVARLLHLRGFHAEVFFIGNEKHATEQTRQQLSMVQSYGVPIYGTDHVKRLSACTLLVDAIFGVGLSRNVEGVYAQFMEEMNKCSAPTVAVDIPSGIDAGHGAVLGCAVKAAETITFAFCKAGLVLYPGADYAGHVTVKDIGIGAEGIPQGSKLYSYETGEVLRMLPVRQNRSNKGTYGRTVLIVGSKGMAGAAYLAGIAAYRSGCGLVRIVTPQENREIIQSLLPEAVLTTYDSNAPDMDVIDEAIQWGDCIGIGSGLGLSESAAKLLQETIRRTNVPLVIDADGLNLLCGHLDIIGECPAPVVVTPHLGEMARLTGKPVHDIREQIVKTAQEFADTYSVCCVLKDARTVVADGSEHAYINLTGNHGMATGGSGDVLLGMVSGLTASGMKPREAAIAAVHLHGRAGDIAAKSMGERCMTARDITDAIPSAFMLCVK